MVLGAVLALAIGATPARAEMPASPLLPPDHWASEAVSRLDQLGLLGEWLPAQKSVHLQAAADAFARAVALAAAEHPEVLPLVQRWRAKLAREFPGIADGATVLGARLSAGAEAGRERTVGAPSAAPRTVRLDPPNKTGLIDLGGAVRPARWITAAATLRTDALGGAVQDADVCVAWSWLSLHAGRARPGFGFQPGGGVMLSGNAPVDRVELLTSRPVRLPWVFGLVGTWTADTFVSRLGGERWPDNPYFWATSLRLRIHPRFTLGGQRAILFGGQPWRGFPFWHRTRVVFGFDNYRENNMLTVSARWRLPTERVIPLVLDVDWGTDDDPLAAVKVPAIVTSFTAPRAGPGGLSAAVEFAWFGRACCRDWDAPWYTHDQYPGGWTVGETPLGDPLGGNGRALRLRVGAEPSRHLRLGSTLWAQDRFSTNLYAPQADGRSYGGRLQAEWRAGRAAVALRGSHEHGTAGWASSDVALRGTLFF